MNHVLGGSNETDVCPYCYYLFAIEETGACKKCGAYLCPLCDKCECDSQHAGRARSRSSNQGRLIAGV